VLIIRQQCWVYALDCGALSRLIMECLSSPARASLYPAAVAEARSSEWPHSTEAQFIRLRASSY
jgi:hypothetical protein